MAELAGRSFGWTGRRTALLLRPLILVLALGLPQVGHAQAPTPPLPPPRPDRLGPDEEKRKDPRPEAEEQQALPAGEPDTACLERLDKLGLHFEKRPAVQENDCRITSPVEVSSLPNGVQVAPASLMECRYAESLARWVSEVVLPRAREHLASAPTKLLIGTSYQCRDQRSGSKLSEHAFGNGVDVMGLEFDKHPPLTIKFQAEGSPEAAFQSAIQREACTVFTTVLGPGTEDHGDHLHLDMRARKADYRICQ